MKKSLLAFTLVALISSISVTEYINEAEAQTSVTQTVETEALIEEAEPVKEEEPVNEEPVEETFWMNLGSFEITAYCSGTCCSSGTGITASGNPAVEVDPDIIPLGSKVKIVFTDGTEHVYRADDTGSAINGNIIDLYMGTAESGGHERALQFGRQTCRVYVEEINEPSN